MPQTYRVLKVTKYMVGLRNAVRRALNTEITQICVFTQKHERKGREKHIEKQEKCQ